MQLSQKQKTFDELFFVFLKFILNFEHFPKRMTHSWSISEIKGSKKRR